MEDVEEGLAEAVAGRAGGFAVRSLEQAGTIGAGDDAHRANGISAWTGRAEFGGAYNGGMRGWSFPIGRYFGVDVRIHTFFLLLLGVAISYATVGGATGGRGFALWLMLVLAVAVREVARAIAAAWYNLDVRSILLLPIGGLMSYASPEATERASTPEMQKRMAVVGPIANLGFGLVLGALVVTFTPQINLFEQPWITPAYLLRSLIWMNMLLGAVNLLPAAPLDGGRVFRGEFAKARGGIRGAKAAAGIGQIIAYALIVAGMVIMVSGTTAGMWPLMIGLFLLIGARMEDQGLLLQRRMWTRCECGM